MQTMQRSSIHIRSIAADLILTILTCGLYNIYLQYKQMEAVNEMLKQVKYAFLSWFVLSLITCGLYHVYHEWRMSVDICNSLNQPNSNEPLACLILSVMGLSFVADALQQAQINRYYGSDAL